MYGLDPYDLYTGRLDPGTVWDLLVNLPPGARLWRELGGPGSWEPMEWWAAALVDLAAEANWQRTEAAQDGRDHPRPIPRPVAPVRGSDRRSEERAAFDRAAVFRARQAAARGGAGKG